MVSLIALIVAATVAFALLAWWAGRLPRAHGMPDPVRAPRLEFVAAVVGYLGMVGGMFGFIAEGFSLTGAAIVVGVGIALLSGTQRSDLRWVWRSWLPLLPLILGVAIPKALMLGPVLLSGLVIALPSGIIQQLLLQVGLMARLEAFTSRSDVAAVGAALAFGFVHTPLNMPQADGDALIALANALVLQAPIGLVFCLGYLRHRAPVALGAVHALAMA